MKVIAIVQARMGSTRLPGKVLQDIAGKPMLERVIERLRRCKRLNGIVIAATDSAADDAIAALCARLGVPIFRGSESDVLDRYARAAALFPAEACVRITSDCPLIDPGVVDELILRFESAEPPVDYASNKIPQSFPRGLDAEIFTCEALRRAANEASEPFERAHVTVYMYQHPERFGLLSFTDEVDRADWRWTVDTPEDLEFVREVYVKLGPSGDFDWGTVVALIEREPALTQINAHVEQKDVREG